MNREHYEALVSCAGWGPFQKFLMDKRAFLMEQIAEGAFSDQTLKEAIFRCQNLKDMAEMDWDTIEKFYKPEETREN